MISKRINYKKELLSFRDKNEHLKIIERRVPHESDLFFKKLLKFLSSISGFVNYSSANKDIKTLLKEKLPQNIKSDPFYEKWIQDMSCICKLFCEFQKEDRISFWIGSKRGCKRFHVDMVPYRLLLTYLGQGTEYLPNYAANRNAFFQNRPNNEIVKDQSALRFVNNWDIAIFRGGRNGILHRTPTSALNSGSSILMKLDNQSFLQSMKLNVA
tara:strand:+ start:791 stop:1429 length:639 start_codon:yes stop_codon:yes gene_type:complete